MSVRDLVQMLGRDAYVVVLTELVRSRLDQEPLPADYFLRVWADVLRNKGAQDTVWQLASRLEDMNPPLLQFFRSITGATHVLMKTSVLHYRGTEIALPQPCTLDQLVGIVGSIRNPMISALAAPGAFELEWLGPKNILVFVPTLGHRFACTVSTTVSMRTFRCVEYEKIAEELGKTFDDVTQGLEEVPENFGDLDKFVGIAVYDLRVKDFIDYDVDTAYAKWVAANCSSG